MKKKSGFFKNKLTCLVAVTTAALMLGPIAAAGETPNASRTAIDKFVSENSNSGGGLPLVDPRTPYSAANNRFCISGDCHQLINSFLVSDGAFKVEKEGTSSLKVEISGSPFRAYTTFKFSPSVDFANIFDADGEKVYPLCEAGCTSLKINSMGGHAMLLIQIEKDGTKTIKLYLNINNESEADGGSLIKTMDDYYQKHGQSLEHTEDDPKKEPESPAE